MFRTMIIQDSFFPDKSQEYAALYRASNININHLCYINHFLYSGILIKVDVTGIYPEEGGVWCPARKHKRSQ